jgi:hypothetical protein
MKFYDEPIGDPRWIPTDDWFITLSD